ncbi:hypothetical protein ACVRZR_06625 [Streptococcus entericus]|uniref:hypothetical protein n=1 Tax=Streptococcus entericus TaxID=155680 RepID=UPI00035C09D4|nr:hypothetical protein [Streptococcus entericus]
MELFTARSRYSSEGVTWTWYRNDDEVVHSELALSDIFRLIRKELDKFIDYGILTKEQAYDLANDWLAYDEFVEGMMYT